MSRNRRLLAAIAPGVATLVVVTVTATPTSTPQAPDIDDVVNERLGLGVSTVQLLDIVHDAGRFGSTEVTIDGNPMTLRWGPHSVRAEGYQLRAQVADGTWVDVDPGPEHSIRGVVEGIPGSRTAGAVHDDGLYLTILFPDGGRYWIEPVPADVPGAEANSHVVYHNEDVLPTGMSCGMAAQRGPDAMFGAEPGPPADGGGAVAGGGAGVPFICVTELACDADVEYHDDWGGVVPAQNRITLVINTMNLQYEEQVAITHVLTTILVRTSEPDPYSSFNSTDLLCQFINEWTLNLPEIDRDVAQLFTGRDISGGTIGQAAQFGGICLNDGCPNFPCNCGQFGTSGGYCHSQSDFNNNFACATDLSSHELGHLWNAPHCNCLNHTMHTPIQCANVFFPATVNTISSFRDSVGCIDCAGALAFSFPEGIPELLDRKSGDSFIMVVEGESGTPQPNTGEVHVSVDGGPFQSMSLPEIETNVYEVFLGPFECGSLVEFYFSAETTGGIEVSEPLEAPEGAFLGISATDVIAVFEDDMEQDLGWGVQNGPGLTAGAWERGIPVDCSRGDPPTDADGSGQSYLTDNDQGDCNSDVDGGSTTVTSPVLDASGGEDALVRYSRWFHNSFGAEPFTETFTVEVSDDGGSSWSNLETVGPAGPEVSGGWFRKQFKLSEIGIEANDQFRIRFTTQDPDPGSVVEAGVDGVELVSIVCLPGVPCFADVNGDLEVDVLDLVEVILNWGPCGGCPADVNFDGEVDVLDLVDVILFWGPC